MKNLISVTADENGEQFYFTHKGGVELINKSEIADIELCNVMFKRTTDRFEFYISWFMSVSLFILPIFLFSFLLKEGFFVGYFISAWFYFGLFYLFATKVNSRRILKVYSLKKVYSFKIRNEQGYTDLYRHFKKQLFKYLPKEGDLLLYSENPKNNLWRRSIMYISIMVGSIAALGLIIAFFKSSPKDYLLHNWGYYIGVIVICTLVAFDCRASLNTYRVSYIFYSEYLEKHTITSENHLTFNLDLDSITVFRNNHCIGIKNDGTPEYVNRKSDYLRFWRDKRGDVTHQLKVSEEYRDISPIIYAFLKEKSNQQPFV